jgi:hypothetical protein
MRVYAQAITLGGSVKGRWLDIRCHCCPSCYQKGRRLGRAAWVAGLLWLAAIPVGIAAGCALSLLVSLAGGNLDMGLAAGLGAALGFFATLFVVTPLYVSRSFRSGILALFQGSPTEAQLRHTLGIKKWGFWGRLYFYPAPPRNRSALTAFLLGLPRAENTVDMELIRGAGGR